MQRTAPDGRPAAYTGAPVRPRTPQFGSRRRLVALAIALALGLGAAAAGGAASAGGRDAGASQAEPVDPNPCLGPEAAELRCPDLEMSPPFDLTIDRRTRRGRRLLRAGNSIDSLGAGPAELRGRRDGRRTMDAVQRIYRLDGTRIRLETGARLIWKRIPGQGHYWKFNNAARFELWRLDELNNWVELVRTGPKIAYCLRDLKRLHPGRPGSPRRRVYPACSQRYGIGARTLGTSVGWSDVYPAGYHEQWVDVTGLSGRFELVHEADPRNGIYESDETNNEAGTFVRLPSGDVFGRRRAGSTPTGGGYYAPAR
jgi:hypothetical protein